MTKKLKKAIAAKRLNAFSLDPDDVVVIGVDTQDGREHSLWDKRSFDPLEEATVRNIATYGVIEPIIVVKDGDKVIVADGRRRVLHAREAKKRQLAAGEITVMIPAVLKKGSDARIFGISRSANAHRKNDDAMTNAENAGRMMDLGASVDDVAVTFGVETQTVKIWLTLLDADASVKKAVQAGELAPSAAAKLAKLSREEQRKALIQMRAEGKITVAKASAKVAASKNGKTATPAPGKKILRRIAEDKRLPLDFIKGIRFALGDLSPRSVEGLTDLLREIEA